MQGPGGRHTKRPGRRSPQNNWNTTKPVPGVVPYSGRFVNSAFAISEGVFHFPTPEPVCRSGFVSSGGCERNLEDVGSEGVDADAEEIDADGSAEEEKETESLAGGEAAVEAVHALQRQRVQRQSLNHYPLHLLLPSQGWS